MPMQNILEFLPAVVTGQGQRCELYLRRPDADALLARAVAAGGQLLQPISARTWGEDVGYALDADGHVLAVARACGTSGWHGAARGFTLRAGCLWRGVRLPARRQALASLDV
ncbi:MAG: hypothetical protein IPL94_13245 [Tetrasphaera sp.]|nr:hypothetical protein [Tetrasphaera sp.]